MTDKKKENKKVVGKAKKPLHFKIGWILLGILLFYLLTSAKSVQLQDIEDYNVLLVNKSFEVKQVTRTVTEPRYIEVDEPYGFKTCLDVIYNYSTDLRIENIIEPDEENLTTHYLACYYDITNNEDIDGNWTFVARFHKEDRSLDRDSLTQEVKAGKTSTFKWRYPQGTYGQVLSCEPIKVEIPKREKCEFAEPITYRKVKRLINVTVEKIVNETVPVEINQTIQKQRKSQKTIFRNRFFGYKQFFYLGY